MARKKAFPLRLDPRLYDALRRWADAELRSVNAQIEFVLRQAVRSRFGSVPGLGRGEEPGPPERSRSEEGGMGGDPDTPAPGE
jgi:hypothetical protein